MLFLECSTSHSLGKNFSNQARTNERGRFLGTVGRVLSLGIGFVVFSGCSGCNAESVRDAGIDAGVLQRDAGREVTIQDASVDAWRWTGNRTRSCRRHGGTIPANQRQNPSCGGTCEFATSAGYGGRGKRIESIQSFVVASETVLVRVHDNPTESVIVSSPYRSFPDGGSIALCNIEDPTGWTTNTRGIVGGITRTANGVAVICGTPDGWEIVETDDTFEELCTVFSIRNPRYGVFGPEGYLTRVDGGYAFLWNEGRYRSDVWILEDGSDTPRKLTNCGCINNLVGSGDKLAFIFENERGGNTLWMSVAPFTTLQKVWEPGRSLSHLTADPTNPHRVVFEGGVTDEVCAAQSDIYFADLDHLREYGVRNLTSSDGTQVEPFIRGDQVIYIDFGQEPLNPNGCVEDPHQYRELVLTSLAHGGRTVLHGGPSIPGRFQPGSPTHLGERYAFFLCNDGLARVPLP